MTPLNLPEGETFKYVIISILLILFVRWTAMGKLGGGQGCTFPSFMPSSCVGGVFTGFTGCSSF